MSRTYKIRTFVNGKNKAGEPFVNHSLTLPSDVAKLLPSDITFTCSLTDDGILFRPAIQATGQPAQPAWARE